MICVKEESGDLKYSILYKDPLFNLGSEKTRNSVLKKIMDSFAINLNNIKHRNDLPSDKLYGFRKFYGETFVDVSMGVQELSVVITRLQDKQQAYDILNKIISIAKKIKGFEIAIQKLVLSQHYSSDEDTDIFFKNLNPVTPEGLADTITSQGIVYNLIDDENSCQITLLVNNSLTILGGIFISADLHFSPNKFSFPEMFAFAKKRYSEIAIAVGMDIKKR